jgi:hypothetical protein
MNERFAAEPEVSRGWLALKHLLQHFGPLNGRYLTAYPRDWRAKVESLNGTLGEMDLKRVKSLLESAREGMQIISAPSLPYRDELSWLENAVALLNEVPRRLDGVVTDEKPVKPPHTRVFQLHELALPPAAEERIFATPREYVRVSKTLLLATPELCFVDPFLNPCERNVSDVLAEMFEVAVNARCESIVCWAKASILLDKKTGRHKYMPDDIRRALDSVVPPTRKSLKVVLNLVDDSRGVEPKMHGRYLLSRPGGIRFELGFQALPRGRKVDVGPITARATLDEDLDLYHVKYSPFRIKHQIRISRG